MALFYPREVKSYTDNDRLSVTNSMSACFERVTHKAGQSRGLSPDQLPISPALPSIIPQPELSAERAIVLSLIQNLTLNIMVNLFGFTC